MVVEVGMRLEAVSMSILEDIDTCTPCRRSFVSFVFLLSWSVDRLLSACINTLLCIFILSSISSPFSSPTIVTVDSQPLVSFLSLSFAVLSAQPSGLIPHTLHRITLLTVQIHASLTCTHHLDLLLPIPSFATTYTAARTHFSSLTHMYITLR